MENKKFDILVNFEGTDSISSDPITLVLGDYNSVDLVFQLSKTGTLQLFYLIKPNGKQYVTAISNNRVTIDDASIFNEVGRYFYGVTLYDNDSKLTNVQKGTIDVIDNGMNIDQSEIEDNNNYKILDDLIKRVEALEPSFNINANNKLQEFNNNASLKTDAFNNNYTNKLNSFNSSVLTFEESLESSGITFNEYADSTRIEECIKNYFALTPDYGVYTVRFPLWETSHTSTGEKLDANAGKYVNLATDTIQEETNYGEAWTSYDVNAVVDENGVRHITAIKGMPNYKDTGKVDVFCLFRTYYQKIYEEDGYLYISRSFVPREGFTVCSNAINKDGTINPWFVIGKYTVGTIDGKLYSSKGLIPAHYIGNSSPYSNNINYNDCVTKMHAKGQYYSAGLMADYLHILTTFYLKFATKNTQSIMAGKTNNNLQYQVAITESNVKRVVLTNSQADNFDIDTCISVGDVTTNTDKDRSKGWMHNIAYNVRIIDKEEVDSTHTALLLDCDDITTTETTWVSTMHEISGYSDKILGRTGSVTSNTNGRHGMVFDGIELSVGGYEVGANAFMDIVNSNGAREIYITNDASKLTTNVTTAKNTYKKSNLEIPSHTGGSWKYITKMKFDLINGLAVPTDYGNSGSGSGVGYADGYIANVESSGQKEFLLLGTMSYGTTAGLSCLNGYNGISSGYWHILARLSINGVGGELAE